MIKERDRIDFKMGMGWIPDPPDFRDYGIDKDNIEPKFKNLRVKDSIVKMLSKINFSESSKAHNSPPINLIEYCSPIESQEGLGSCTAQAGVGLVEYFERRAFGKHINASRLFLYKTTRNLLHLTGDTGATLRATMAAMQLFGVPPEGYMPYVVEDFDKEPSAFCYSYGKEYQAIQYYRLDPPFIDKELLLNRIKSLLIYGLPSMFGFSVFNSYVQAIDDGEIPYPYEREYYVGGHAIVAIGFDDEKEIKNDYNGKSTTGALLIRNSWGPTWGDNGYGWLPYEYILTGLARDFWSLLKNEWFDEEKFGL